MLAIGAVELDVKSMWLVADGSRQTSGRKRRARVSGVDRSIDGGLLVREEIEVRTFPGRAMPVRCLNRQDTVRDSLDILHIVRDLDHISNGAPTMVSVGLLSVSPLPRIFMVGHNKLSFLPSLDCLIEYTSSAYSTRLSAAGSHMPLT